jgi:hypothetical protein
MEPMMMSVMDALRDSGLRKAGTPFEMASMPVRATAPEEKARRKIEVAGERPDQPDENEGAEADDVDVGRAGEQPAGLLQPAEVGEGHDGDEPETDLDPFGPEYRECGGDRGDASGDRDGHGQDIVDEQGGPCHQGREFAEVLAADDIRASAARIGMDRLAVTRDDQNEQDHDDDRDRDQLIQGDGEPSGGHQDEEDLLAGVGGGGDRVGGEHGQRGRFAEPLLVFV